MATTRDARSLWRGTAGKADVWASIGASPFVVRTVKYGIRDMPLVPFTESLVIAEIPQSEEDYMFAKELERGVAVGVLEDVGEQEMGSLVGEGKMVSSSFVA